MRALKNLVRKSIVLLVVAVVVAGGWSIFAREPQPPPARVMYGTAAAMRVVADYEASRQGVVPAWVAGGLLAVMVLAGLTTAAFAGERFVRTAARVGRRKRRAPVLPAHPQIRELPRVPQLPPGRYHND